VLADGYIVTYLNQVIDLHVRRNARGTERAAIDCRVAADLNIVANFNGTDLRKLPMAAFAENVSESVASDHYAGMNFDILT
jgi:hypothetical protein